ncbi:hypothetical protein [Lactococcus lactis]
MNKIQQTCKTFFKQQSKLINEKQFWQIQLINGFQGIVRLGAYLAATAAFIFFLSLTLIQKPLATPEAKTFIIGLSFVVVFILFFMTVLFPLAFFVASSGEKGKFFNSLWILFFMIFLSFGTLSNSTEKLVELSLEWMGYFLVIAYAALLLKIVSKALIFKNIDNEKEFERWTPFMRKVVSEEVKEQDFTYDIKNMKSGYDKTVTFKTKLKFKYSFVWITRSVQKHDPSLELYDQLDKVYWPLDKFTHGQRPLIRKKKEVKNGK